MADFLSDVVSLRVAHRRKVTGKSADAANSEVTGTAAVGGVLAAVVVESQATAREPQPSVGSSGLEPGSA